MIKTISFFGDDLWRILFYKSVQEFTDKNWLLINRVLLILILILDITFHAHYF